MASDALTKVDPVDPNIHPPPVHFSMKVALVHKIGSTDIKPHIEKIIKWYQLGAEDVHSISEFTIQYDEQTNIFEVVYILLDPEDIYMNIRLADPDEECLFPIVVDGVRYRVVGTVV